MNWLFLIESILLVWNEFNCIAYHTIDIQYSILCAQWFVIIGKIHSIISFFLYSALSNNESISHTPTIEYTPSVIFWPVRIGLKRNAIQCLDLFASGVKSIFDFILWSI